MSRRVPLQCSTNISDAKQAACPSCQLLRAIILVRPPPMRLTSFHHVLQRRSGVSQPPDRPQMAGIASFYQIGWNKCDVTCPAPEPAERQACWVWAPERIWEGPWTKMGFDRLPALRAKRNGDLLILSFTCANSSRASSWYELRSSLGATQTFACMPKFYI